MRDLPKDAVDALNPLRSEILARAHAAAEATASQASHRTARVIKDAEVEAAAITRQAVERGMAAARSDAAQRSARERRRAHEIELAGREALRQALEDRVVSRAAELRNEAGYRRLLDGLEARAHELLGQDARVEEHPDGGVVGTAGARRVDLSLPALALSTLESMTGEVAELWTP